ncbi:MAG: hypothetical protein ACRDSL_03875 [Pseudonocardiaceae bacterium]
MTGLTLGAMLLADSRLPTGGHAHSGGVEAAVQRGLLRNEADLALFLEALHQLLSGACSAVVRLLGLDPIRVAAVQARMSQPVEEAAQAATRVAGEAVARSDTRLLPSTGTPLPEVLAELHARAEVTLFAS